MKDKKLEAALTKKPEAAQEHPRIRTGCDLLDILLGGKAKTYGLEAGTILGVWGDSGAGKSFVINEMIAANHYRNPKKFRWLNSDGENGNKFDCPKLYGFEISSEGKPLSGFVKGERGTLKPATITFHHSTTVQEMDAHVSLFLSGLKDDEYAIYAQDSLDSVKDAGAEEAMQERPVSVYYLIASGTIDEDMAEALDEKKKVLASVLDGKQASDLDLIATIAARRGLRL